MTSSGKTSVGGSPVGGTRRQGWQENAACQGEDGELFFPDRRDPAMLETQELAKAICKSCPVTAECLNYSTVFNIEYGIFGGLDEKQRAQLRGARYVGRKRVVPDPFVKTWGLPVTPTRATTDRSA